MNPKPQAKKLPTGYRLGRGQTGEGTYWYVERVSDGAIITRGKNPKLAVDRFIALDDGKAEGR